ncbi:hypothetical protein PoB_000563800 [Plakobranchus ocellatus]|uniref:Uncharacterized protein n=1 Tax=Plakobranchus ocellatus TaxID=259542 RepID=A0AAV3YAG4_9GAST|nr:hypothetical protein PoB_000563800 [Plakobranchus ocellatus]
MIITGLAQGKGGRAKEWRRGGVEWERGGAGHDVGHFATPDFKDTVAGVPVPMVVTSTRTLRRAVLTKAPPCWVSNSRHPCLRSEPTMLKKSSTGYGQRFLSLRSAIVQVSAQEIVANGIFKSYPGGDAGG